MISRGERNVFRAVMIGAVFLLSSTGAFAAEILSEWKHLALQSEESIQVVIDYQVLHWSDASEYGYTANPVWINVRAASSRVSLSAANQIRVILKSYRSFDSELPVDSQTIDLAYAGDGRFTAQVPNGLLLFENNESLNTNCRNVLSVVVSGEWQTDPMTSNHDFNLLLN